MNCSVGAKIGLCSVNSSQAWAVSEAALSLCTATWFHAHLSNNLDAKLQPLENKEAVNSASLEISKGCEIVSKYVEAFIALAVTNVHCRD